MPRYTIQGETVEELFQAIWTTLAAEAARTAIEAAANAFGEAPSSSPAAPARGRGRGTGNASGNRNRNRNRGRQPRQRDGGSAPSAPTSLADLPEEMTLADAQRVFGVSYALLKRLEGRGEMTVRVDGRFRFVKRDEVARALAAHRDETERVQRAMTRAGRQPAVPLEALETLVENVAA